MSGHKDLHRIPKLRSRRLPTPRGRLQIEVLEQRRLLSLVSQLGFQTPVLAAPERPQAQEAARLCTLDIKHGPFAKVGQTLACVFENQESVRSGDSPLLAAGK